MPLDSIAAVSVAVYRLLLFFYPAEFRHEYGAEMTRVFRRQCRQQCRSRGAPGIAQLWFEVLADFFLVAPKERLSMLIQDLRYSLRALRKHSVFSAVAILTVALGIGSNTAIFSVVHSILLRPLPFAQPDSLAMIFLNHPERGNSRMTVADFFDWRAHDRAFDEIAVFGMMGNRFNILGNGEPGQAKGIYASGRFFSVLGTKPVAGRLFRNEDDQPGRSPVVVLSERLWRQRYGGDPNAVGQILSIQGRQHTIIGVAPATFAFPAADTELWAILTLNPPGFRGPYYLRGIGRLHEGISCDQATSQLSAVPIGLTNGAAPDQKTIRLAVVGLHEQMVGDVRPALLVLLGAVGFVLLIAAANVANLLLARATARSREIAIRLSLGAGRLQIVRHVLTESLLLSFFGGVLGVALAFAGIEALRLISPGNLPRLDEVQIDLPVLSFATVISLLTGLLFGLAPALHAAPSNVSASLKDGARGGTDSAGRRRFRSALVISEIALSFILLIGAGLLLRSFLRLQEVDLGVRTDHLIAAEISASGRRYSDDTVTRTFYRDLIARVRALPGVESAGLSNQIPPNQGGFWENFTLEGWTTERGPSILILIVEPGYFRTMQVPLLRGRYFAESDTPASQPVTIISEAMAQRYFPNQDPVGKRLRIGGPERPNTPWREIIGVVGDVKYGGREAEVQPAFYAPHAQNTARSMYLVVRAAVDPAGLGAALRREMQALDKELPIARLITIEQLLDESVAQPRFRTLLLVVFAAIALLLAVVGIYGVIAYSVAQRTQEIGIRAALGASQTTLVRMVLREGLTIAVFGVVIGVFGAWALNRFLEKFLFGIGPADPITFAFVSVSLVFAAAAASYIPARRASNVDPMAALRA